MFECSSPLYEIANSLRIAYAHPSMFFKLSLNYNSEYKVNAAILQRLGNTDKKFVHVQYRCCFFFPEYIWSLVHWILECGNPRYEGLIVLLLPVLFRQEKRNGEKLSNTRVCAKLHDSNLSVF